MLREGGRGGLVRGGSLRQRAGRGLIKLVQLLIRWKAFNLDNLLTTWPTHYTFPISDNLRSKARNISRYPADGSISPSPPRAWLPRANSHDRTRWWLARGPFANIRKKPTSCSRWIPKRIPKKRFEGFGEDRRWHGWRLEWEEAGPRGMHRCTFGALVASWTVSPWRYLSHKQGALFSSRWSSDTIRRPYLALYLYVRV